MQNTGCPKCGHDLSDAGCPKCSPVAANGAVPVPPEVAGWKIEHASPDVLAWAAQTFDMEAFLAGKREIEAGGGVQIDDLIAEIERIVNGKA